MTFADRVIEFNRRLNFSGELPEGIRIMNPYRENQDALRVSCEFYRKFFNDTNNRYIILGINPGRFGAGTTGIPFTDTIRLNEKCGIPFEKFRTYEPSSSFIYEMIGEYGGTELFYRRYYISAICPLGFTSRNQKGKDVNYNYYDDPRLTASVKPFIVETMGIQLQLGINRDVCFCLGTGKNDSFLRKMNEEYNFFKTIVTLEHPRFIMQYKSRNKNDYIRKYVESLKETRNRDSIPDSFHNGIHM